MGGSQSSRVHTKASHMSRTKKHNPTQASRKCAPGVAQCDDAAEQKHLHRLCVSVDINQRDYMEDSNVAITSKQGDFQMYAVFDGHGGKAVAQLLARKLPKRVFAELKLVEDASDVAAVKKRITRAFTQFDASMFQKCSSPFTVGGSTASVLVIAFGRMWFANVGDSRAAQYHATSDSKSEYKLTFATRDHTWRSKAERKRIEKVQERLLGGRKLSEERWVPRHVRGYVSRWYATTSSDGAPVQARVGLEPTRSFGDFRLKVKNIAGPRKLLATPVIVATPEISVAQLTDSFVVLASDGMWFDMEHDEVAKALSSADVEDKCAFLLKRAKDANGNRDNVTVMVVKIDAATPNKLVEPTEPNIAKSAPLAPLA